MVKSRPPCLQFVVSETPQISKIYFSRTPQIQVSEARNAHPEQRSVCLFPAVTGIKDLTSIVRQSRNVTTHSRRYEPRYHTHFLSPVNTALVHACQRRRMRQLSTRSISPFRLSSTKTLSPQLLSGARNSVSLVRRDLFALLLQPS
jgi:hypothetical protein